MVLPAPRHARHSVARRRLLHTSFAWGCRRYGLAPAICSALLAVLWATVAMPAKLNKLQSSVDTQLVMVQSTRHFEVLHALCCISPASSAACSGVNPDRFSSEQQHIFAACLKRLPAGLRCDHIYTHTVKGVAGPISDLQICRLRQCLTGGAQLHNETDGKVVKAEGPLSKRPALHAAHRQLLATPPSQRLQSGIASSPVFNHSNSSVTDEQQERAVSTAGGRPVVTDGGPDSVEAARRAWLKAAVGNSSQQQLSRGWVTLPTLVWEAPTASVLTTANNSSAVSSNQQAAVMRELSVLLQQSFVQNGTRWVPRVKRVRTVKKVDTDGMQQSAVGQQTLQKFGRQPDGQVNNPRAPDTPSMPTAPPELSDTAPGPHEPVPLDSLAALAQVVDKPIIKVERLPPALWALDRIDQRDLPLDGEYTYGSSAGPGTGSGVTVYALDSGVRATHQEFQSWSSGNGSRASYGYDFVSDDNDADDCDGHGTHVGATAIGRSVGVAKCARLVAVRVLDCTGSGSISDTVAGLDWVAQHAQRPALVIMSLGVAEGSWSHVLEQATLSLINDHGISVIVASGNSGTDACKISPARLNEVITVAASNLDNKFTTNNMPGKDLMYRWSNTGPCVTLFAPGVEIWSACGGTSRCPVVTDDAYTWASGTSMAVPHVAGVAALYLSQNPSASPSQVVSALTDTASWGRIQDNRMRSGTPNKLLYSRAVLTAPAEPAVQAAGRGG